jgi:GTP-binding protein
MRISSATFERGITGTDEILYDGVPQIAFVGRSNVGKSSVINSLVGEEGLARAGKKPGKTTEINFFRINNAVYFVDLPGYGYAHLTPVQREKIRKQMLWYLRESGVKPRYVVLVLDCRVGFMEFDHQMIHILKETGHKVLILANKIDKLNQRETSQQLAALAADASGADIVPYSATSKNKKQVQALLTILLTP